MAANAERDISSRNALPVCLWQENPNRLVSLWEIMELFSIWDHQEAIIRLQNRRSGIEILISLNGGNQMPVEHERQECIKILAVLREECYRLALDSSVSDLISFTIIELNKGQGASRTNDAIRTRLNDIDFLFRNQCSKVKFLKLTPDESFMLDNSSLFGSAVADAFPSDETTYEIREAGSCFALGSYTATVFHLMRVLEKGLKALADELSVPFSIPFDYLNWQNIIEQIESEIKNIGKIPAGKYKTDTLKAYSEVAKQFRYFKDAWRNSVAHSRETYGRGQASTILHHVREFMEDLVKLGLHE